jgi:uncharacterized metal-binding protein YceD (DUF177 family)
VIVQIIQILKTKQYFLDEKIDKISLPDGVSLKDGIYLKAQITHGDNKEIFIKENIKAIVNLQCVVCLDDFQEDYNVDFEETYLPESSVEFSLDIEERSTKELDIFFYKNNRIGTKEISRDILLANISPYPTCTKCMKST